MIQYFTKAPPRFFAVIVAGGLMAGMLVFLAVQAMPILGWILWMLTIAAVIASASRWYRREFVRTQQAEEDSRRLTQQRTSEKGRAEMRRQRAARRHELLAKYSGNQNLVERIVLGSYWDGQTATQLKDALGNPADIAARMQKGKRREIWKYHPVGGNRYALWITLEQDLVVQWEQRA